METNNNFYEIIVVDGESKLSNPKDPRLQKNKFFQIRIKNFEISDSLTINNKKMRDLGSMSSYKTLLIWENQKKIYFDAIQEEIELGNFTKVGGDNSKDIKLTQLPLQGEWVERKTPFLHTPIRIVDGVEKPLIAITKNSEGKYTEETSKSNSVSAFVFPDEDKEVIVDKLIRKAKQHMIVETQEVNEEESISSND